MQTTQVALPIPVAVTSSGERRASPAPAATPALPATPAVPPVAAPEKGEPKQAPLVPVHALPHRTPSELLVLARRGLAEAAETGPDGLRFAAAHLAALRAAAAMLAARARPAPGRRGRLTSVWSLLVLVAPEFGEWATFFAAGASKRAAAEAGIPRVVSAREADDLLRAAEQFVALVEIVLGVARTEVLTRGSMPESGGAPSDSVPPQPTLDGLAA